VVDITQPPSKVDLFKAGAWRGAKFGALIGLVIAIGIESSAFVAMFFNPAFRAHAFDEHPTALSMIGGTIAGCGLVMLYGALAGALIMGLANIRRRRSG
jgi:hypothetical protein